MNRKRKRDDVLVGDDERDDRETSPRSSKRRKVQLHPNLNLDTLVPEPSDDELLTTNLLEETPIPRVSSPVLSEETATDLPPLPVQPVVDEENEDEEEEEEPESTAVIVSLTSGAPRFDPDREMSPEIGASSDDDEEEGERVPEKDKEVLPPPVAEKTNELRQTFRDRAVTRDGPTPDERLAALESVAPDVVVKSEPSHPNVIVISDDEDDSEDDSEDVEFVEPMMSTEQAILYIMKNTSRSSLSTNDIMSRFNRLVELEQVAEVTKDSVSRAASKLWKEGHLSFVGKTGPGMHIYALPSMMKKKRKRKRKAKKPKKTVKFVPAAPVAPRMVGFPISFTLPFDPSKIPQDDMSAAFFAFMDRLRDGVQ